MVVSEKDIKTYQLKDKFVKEVIEICYDIATKEDYKQIPVNELNMALVCTLMANFPFTVYPDNIDNAVDLYNHISKVSSDGFRQNIEIRKEMQYRKDNNLLS